MLGAISPTFVLAIFVIFFGMADKVLPLHHPYDALRMSELLTLGVGCLVFLFAKLTGRHLLPLPSLVRIRVCVRVCVLALAMLVLLIISGLGSISRLAAFEDIVIFYALALNLCLVYGSFPTEIAKRQALDSVLLIAFCAAAFAIVGRFIVEIGIAAAFGQDIEWSAPFLGFSNVRFFNQFQAYTLFLLPVLAFRLRSVWTGSLLVRVGMVLLSAVWWSMHMLTASRSVWLAVLLTMAIVLILGSKRAFVWLRFQGLSMALGGLIYWAFVQIVPLPKTLGFERLAQDGLQSAERIKLWKCAIQLIQEHLFFGIGPANFPFYYAGSSSHPHNIVLQIACEYGLLALGIFMTLIVLFAIASHRYLRASATGYEFDMNMALFSVIVCGLLDALFSGNNLMPHIQIVAVLLIGWFLGRNRGINNREWKNREGKNNKFPSLFWVLPALCVIAVTSVGGSYAKFMMSPDYTLSVKGPRIWHDGRSGYYRYYPH